MKKSVKVMSFVLATIMSVSILSSCKKGETIGTSNDNSTHFWELYDKVSDTSDLPTWTGKKLKLKVWYSHGTADQNRAKSSNDVVYKEIERVTGIQIDIENSFDNGGQDIKEKLPTMLAVNDSWPELIYNSSLTNINVLVKANKLWDLTDAFNKYCPELNKKMAMDKYKDIYAKYMVNGKLYGLPQEIPQKFLGMSGATFDKDKLNNLMLPTPKSESTFWIRDDILKKVYPNAKTAKEIEDLYVKNNGKFTKEEIFDVPLKNMDDVVSMMYNMQKVITNEGIKENNKPVNVTYGPPIGSDNWDIMKSLPQQIDGVYAYNNYFTQFNKNTGKLELAFKMDYLKNEMKVFNTLINNNIMAKDSFVDSLAIWREKVSNGCYAILYGAAQPDDDALSKAGKTYRYRKVWVDQQYRVDQQVPIEGVPAGSLYSIFKDSVKEEDLPQVMRFFDYMYSDVGEKLLYWGPKSANVWEEKDGKRKFTDKELEDCMVYNKSNGKSLYYGLYNPSVATPFPFPGYPKFMWGGSTLHPKYVYDLVVDKKQAIRYFTPATITGYSVQEVSVVTPVNTNIWSYVNDVPDVSKFWQARGAFEKQLTKVLVSSDATQFEEQYKAMLDIAEKNGLNDKTMEDLNTVFLQTNGEALKKAGLIK